MLATTRDSFAPEALIVVDSDALVWRGLCRVSAREHRDLLVVGSGRRAGDGQVRLGERAQDLLDHLECPLAIAPRGMSNQDQPRLKRIGVGFDDGPEARAALEWAGSLALAAGAQLEVRGVIDDRVPGVLVPEPGGLKGGAVVAKRTKSLLERTLAASRAAGAAVRVDVTSADATHALLELTAGVDHSRHRLGPRWPRWPRLPRQNGQRPAPRAQRPVLVVPWPTNDPAL